VCDLGISLLSVNRVKPEQADKQTRQTSSGKMMQAACSTKIKKGEQNENGEQSSEQDIVDGDSAYVF
jgi:hypothetical protein